MESVGKTLRKIYKLFIREVIKPNFSEVRECPDIKGMMKMLKPTLIRTGKIMFKNDIFDTRYGKTQDWLIDLRVKNRSVYNKLMRKIAESTTIDFVGFSMRILWLFMAFLYSKGWWKDNI
jgi:hypothetical protein